MTSITPLPLGEIAEVIRGVTFSKSEASSVPAGDALPVLRAGNIQGHLLLDEDLLYIPRARVSAKQFLRQDDIVICTSSGSADVVGKTAIAREDWEGSFGAFCAGIRANPKRCNATYLFYYLRSPHFRSWTQQSSGANIKNIRKSELESFDVPLPPLSEQGRVASILSTADSVRRKREEIIVVANEFLNSIFLNMFGDLELNPKGWDTKLIRDVVETDPQNGLYKHSRDYGSGTPILRIDSFYDGYLVAEKSLKRLRIDKETVAKYRLVDGDVVINRVNSIEYLGKSALVEGLEEDTVFESNMMRFRVDGKEMNPRFLVDQLQTQFIKRQILRASKDAVNQSSINQTDVNNFEIRVPPLKLQQTYADIVAKKKRNDLRLTLARQEADHLFSSLSQRAFRGEL